MPRFGTTFVDWSTYVTTRRQADQDQIVWLQLPIEVVYFEPDNAQHTSLPIDVIDDKYNRCFPSMPMNGRFDVCLTPTEKKDAQITNPKNNKLLDHFSIERVNTCLLSIGGSTIHVAQGLNASATLFVK